MSLPAGNNVSPDLHGNAPDSSGVALILVDVINDMEFDGGEELLELALPAADALRGLRERADDARIPVIYVNDNFGRWRSDFRASVERCADGDVRGAPVASQLRPRERDYYVLKPKHSGFFATPLSLLLDHLGASTVVIGGFSTEACIFFTAADAYLREFEVIVAEDGVASINGEAAAHALREMERQFGARICPADEVDFNTLRGTTRCS